MEPITLNTNEEHLAVALGIPRKRGDQIVELMDSALRSQQDTAGELDSSIAFRLLLNIAKNPPEVAYVSFHAGRLFQQMLDAFHDTQNPGVDKNMLAKIVAIKPKAQA